MGEWNFDAPTGVYKNHALSQKIRMEATRLLQFGRWFEPEPGYGKQKGDNVTITRIRQLAAGSRVTEQDDLPVVQPAIETKSVSVSEWGAKIEGTSLEQLLTYFETNSKYRRMLRDQMARTMDKAAADALKSTPVKYIANAASTGVFDTDGTPSTEAANNLSVGHLRQIHDYMSETLGVPRMANGKYIGILSTKAARGIKNDSTYKDWLAPTDPEPFLSGRMKDVEGFALFESNHTENSPGGQGALDNTIGASGVGGEAVFFGQDAGFIAEVLTPELRVGVARDLGRKTEGGWYGILEYGLTWEAAATARVVHLSSS